MSSHLSCGCVISTSCVFGRPLPPECAARQRAPLHPSKLSSRLCIEPAQLQTHPWCRRPQIGTQCLLLQVPSLRPQSWWRWSPFRLPVQRWVISFRVQHPVVSNVVGPLPASLLSSRPARIISPTAPPPPAPTHPTPKEIDLSACAPQHETLCLPDVLVSRLPAAVVVPCIPLFRTAPHPLRRQHRCNIVERDPPPAAPPPPVTQNRRSSPPARSVGVSRG
jgi:hypothetical protein